MNARDSIPSTPMRDESGNLRARAILHHDKWVEFLVAADGEPLVAWDEDRPWPPGAELVRDDAGRVMSLVQVMEVGDDVRWFLTPSTMNRRPQFPMVGVVTRDRQVHLQFDEPGEGIRSLPVKELDPAQQQQLR